MNPGTWRRAGLSGAALALALAALMLMDLGLRWAFLPDPAPGPSGLTGVRFANPDWKGEPSPPYLETRVTMSSERDPDFRPHNFSLRLAGFIDIALPGPYRLGVESDDDSRLYVNGELLVDNTGEHPMRLRLARVWLGPGRNLIEVEYAQRTGQSGLRLWWGRPLRAPAEIPVERLSPLTQTLSRAEAKALGWRMETGAIPWLALLLWGLVAALFAIWFRHAPQQKHLLLASFILLLGMWANSGTLAPLAYTQNKPLRWSAPGAGCAYLVSIDHAHFVATHEMLDGQPATRWNSSLVLRRILYPLTAYPFMKLFGFHEGGFLASLLLHLTALLGWGLFLLKRAGPLGARWGTYALALTPGVYYWSSLPYSYAFIVPGSIWCFMTLARLGEAQSARAVLGWALVMGALFLGYDLWPFFLPAALMLIWWRWRKIWLAAAGLVPLIAPTACMILLLSALGAYSAPVEQGHEPLAVFKSFLGNIDLAAWWRLVAQTPLTLWNTWFFSNYVFLPALFLLLLLLGRKRWPAALGALEGCLLLGTLLVFLFNNLAPPYQGWQFRGEEYLRFYQPLLAALIFFAARKLEAAGARSPVGALCGLALLANAYLVFSPALSLPGGDYLHWRFGRDGSIIAYERNLKTYGRLPYGICPAPVKKATAP